MGSLRRAAIEALIADPEQQPVVRDDDGGLFHYPLLGELDAAPKSWSRPPCLGPSARICALQAGVTLALLLGTAASSASAMSGGAGGSAGASGHDGYGGGGHGGYGHGGASFFHADRFQRRFFAFGLGIGALGDAVLIAPTIYYMPPVYYVPLPTPCTSQYPPNSYPPQGYYPPQAWLEQPCQ